jgi:hypothetical protein
MRKICRVDYRLDRVIYVSARTCGGLSKCSRISLPSIVISTWPVFAGL